MMRAELGASWDHLLAAATHAANGVGQSVTPRASRLKGAAARGWDSAATAFAPLATAYRQGGADGMAQALKLKNRAKAARKGSAMAGKVSNRRTGMLVGLLAAGAAMGAAGALVMRRRRKRQWAEYDETAALDTMSPDARSMMEKAASKSGKAMGRLSHRTSDAMDKTADRLHAAASSMRKGDTRSKPEEAERANEATDNPPPRYESRP